MSSSKYLVSIAGPTAIGKTAVAIQLAQHYQTEIISADSRQFYREMSIGTAKPSPDELAAAPHHFIGSHSILDDINVGDFEREGLLILEDLFIKHDVVIMAGGSGLYVKAITAGFDDLPEADPAIRENLNNIFAEHGITALQEKLLEADPVYYAKVDLHNPQRLIRALEVFESTGQPYSSYRKGTSHQRPFNIIKLGLHIPREELYHRINKRVDIMVESGLPDEVKQLLPYRHLNALNTVGYSEIFDYLDGKTDLPTAIAMIKQNTRRFAKRQLTWFRRDKDTCWFAPTDLAAMIKYIDETIGLSNA
ncbi:tRNA (adenosine(37)-N6)-dimethylallyltransferase MiaA [Mucilaginibacter terrae]|uniref:tRNA dimethylallyltransferase n=1 Tax=Mucilaginibacter terrae TaxID=1955052 RepID=A0ABU3GS51_9SPHI|nr:tRNA (adenosine(37)-N6)-dimethylallyltransferase MiaA [Mucilaginibacter terrae]MDT3402608.1 tRNA dimethylallyltransferase [Mucilaginibacter terrae]